MPLAHRAREHSRRLGGGHREVAPEAPLEAREAVLGLYERAACVLRALDGAQVRRWRAALAGAAGAEGPRTLR